jgi:hypothetical protein
MSNLVTKAAELIYKMNSNELSQVIEAVKLKRQHLSKVAIRAIATGDNVNFTSSKTGQNYTGVVTKVAIKYVTVKTISGSWRVPASMLTVLESF